MPASTFASAAAASGVVSRIADALVGASIGSNSLLLSASHALIVPLLFRFFGVEDIVGCCWVGDRCVREAFAQHLAPVHRQCAIAVWRKLLRCNWRVANATLAATTESRRTAVGGPVVFVSTHVKLRSASFQRTNYRRLQQCDARVELGGYPFPFRQRTRSAPTMTCKIADLWVFVYLNSISWVKRCNISESCVVLAPPRSVMSTIDERGQLLTILRMAAQCVSGIVFVGDGCSAMAQSPEMADALNELSAAARLEYVRFDDIADIEEVATILRALELCATLKGLACSIEAHNAPAMQRLLGRSASLAFVVVVVANSTQVVHLRTTASCTHERRQILTILNADDETARLLTTTLAAVTPQPQHIFWHEIRLHNVAITKSTFEALKHECVRIGNRFAIVSDAEVSRDGQDCVCTLVMTTLKPRDNDSHNALFFCTDRDVTGADCCGKCASAACVTEPAASSPLKVRRVRIAAASHWQTGPAEMAPEFVTCAKPLPQPTAVPPPAPVALQCANTKCVNAAIDHSEYHYEFACKRRVHMSCLAAVLKQRLCEDDNDGGDRCLSVGCTNHMISERILVRIDERGERHIKPPPAAAAAAIAPPIRAPIQRKSKKDKRREQEALRQTAAASTDAIAVEVVAAHTASLSPPPLLLPTAAAPLLIDDSEEVRARARGDVEHIRLTKSSPPPFMKTKKNKQRRGRPAAAAKPPPVMPEAESPCDSDRVPAPVGSADAPQESDANDSNGAVTTTDGIVTAPASPIVDDPMFAAILGEPDAIALSLMTTGSNDVLAVAMLARELRHLAHAGQTIRLARILTAVELLIASHERELAMA